MTHVFWDLDGTLVDPRVGFVNGMRYVAAGLGIECPPDETICGFIGPPLEEGLTGILKTNEPSVIASGVALYRERYVDQGVLENELYPVVPDVLARLGRAANAYISYVVTSKPSVFAEQIVARHGLSGAFRSVHGSELDGRFAKKTELIRHVLDLHGIDAADAVMIGDRRHDAEAARANSVAAIGVLWGYGSRDELVLAGADPICETGDALFNAITAR